MNFARELLGYYGAFAVGSIILLIVLPMLARWAYRGLLKMFRS